MDFKFDSNEEKYFAWWASELILAGYIKKIEYQPESFKLSESHFVDFYTDHKTKSGGKMTPEEIISGHLYTTDCKIIWKEKALGLFTEEINSQKRKKKSRSFQLIICQLDEETKEYYSYVEIKPSFDQNNMTRLAKINIKWVWEKYKIFVNIIIPDKHFAKSFTPLKYMFTDKSGKPRKINYKPVLLLKDYINNK